MAEDIELLITKLVGCFHAKKFRNLDLKGGGRSSQNLIEYEIILEILNLWSFVFSLFLAEK